MKRLSPLLLGLALLLAAACDDEGGEVDSATPTRAETPSPVAATGSPATGQPELKPPDAEAPAAGICAESSGDVATITINPDVPDPRCLKVVATQRIKIVNGTEESIEIELGRFDASLEPGEEELFDAPVGDYLAPGVHVLSASIPSGSAAIWLVEESSP